MVFFRRLALHRFLKMHSPLRQTSPAPRELLSAYDGILPESLLELWHRIGFGLYGDLQLTLIDPGLWQPVLDRWIVSPPNAMRRIPIALTPFGVLLYYRKLTATDEDIAYIDPVSKKTGNLAWSLDDFFNKTLCDPNLLETIVSPVLERSARQECGALEPGEVYEVDQVLLSMQMLRITKVDALDMHCRLRDAVDPPKRKADEPTTVADALPDEYQPVFQEIEMGPGLAGLYLSSYIGWHRLLALQPDGQYRLLFWRIHHKTLERTETRLYTGAYRIFHTAEGDEAIALDISLRADSLGSDVNDDRLIAMRSGGAIWLLQASGLGNIGTAIGGWGEMGRSEHYFGRVRLNDAFVEEPSEGRPAPPLTDLPLALLALIHIEPLRPTITHVASPNLAEEEDGEGTVMCTLDLGENDGLRMNMPLWSPLDTGRHLKGWVWEMDPFACQAGINYRRGEDGSIENGPMVGDILTTRSPDK